MDIKLGPFDIVEKNQDILIHLFFHLLDFDFRTGFFTDESSIHDMGSCGFTNEDYTQLAQLYYNTCPKDYIYTQGQNFYLTLSNKRFDKKINDKFYQTYGFHFDKKIHYLKDFVVLLKQHFPDRNWKQDNIFILKTLDNRIEKQQKEIQSQKKKITRLPVRKKPSLDEIRNGFNEYLMVKELKMNWEDAKKLSKMNFEKQYQEKKYHPYIPGEEE